MNTNHLIYFLLIPFVLFSCNNQKNEKSIESGISNSNRSNLIIAGDLTHLLQYDSIFADITTIPLETNENCLITKVEKVMFYGDKMLLRDQAKKLFVFNSNGKFLNEIAKQGRGPGEVLELRDFDIDSEGNVYVLDFQKIHKYTIEGKFLQSYSFSFSPKDEILCNPLDFARRSNGNFYIWGASFGIDSNPEGKFFAMYEMTKDGKIINRYFPLKHIITGESGGRFTRYKNQIIMNPFFGSNSIYSFDSVLVSEKYFLDFGKKTLDLPIPEDFTSIREFKINIDQSYFHSISHFMETDNWIYFMFTHKMRVYNVYYSKELKKSFLSTVYPQVSGHLTPYMLLGSHDNNLIAFMDADYVLAQINKLKALDLSTLSPSEKSNLERLKQLESTDNPVLFICSLKKY
jgi:hypothetical protein